MKTKTHTAGPWFITEYSTAFSFEKNQFYGVGAPDSRTTIAGPLRKPDALLIAAAPELLAALKKAVALLDEMHPYEFDEIIAKAEGGKL